MKLTVFKNLYCFPQCHPVAIAYTKKTGNNSWGWRNYIVDTITNDVFFFPDLHDIELECTGEIEITLGGKYNYLAKNLKKP